jgi:hypothetical protein
MSEPVSNAEIEDVLSSIRRLVTEEDKKARVVPHSDAAGLGKLVLTPALRIAQPQLRSQPQPTSPPENSAAVEVDLSAENDQVLKDLERRAWSDGAWADTDVGNAEEDEDAFDDAPVAETTAPAPTPEPAVTLEAKIAELEAVIGETKDEWEPNGDEEPTSGYHDWEDADDEAEEPSIMVEEDFQDVEAAAGFDDIEADEDDVAIGDLGLGNDDAVIDEDMLRDLVSEIVRQELQGALGERITRNVRKLVRREIQRALTVKDFE